MNAYSKTPADGPAWAAIVASAVGCAGFGALVVLAEAFKPVSSALNLYDPVGDLSGKSIGGVLIWLVAWVILHAQWKYVTISSPRRLAAAVVILLALALLATFPPLFDLF
jgi:hypothetical protein